MNSPLVSIIMPSFNSAALIRGCLASVLKTTYPNYEIIVVDDQSTDDSYDILQKEYGQHGHIRIIQNETNSGPSKTRNHGIRIALGDYLAFIETDMEVDPQWLEPLVQALETDQSLGGAQSKVLDLINHNVIQSDGIYIDPHTFWVVSKSSGLPASTSQSEKYVGIGAVGSVVRSSVIQQIGGFDEAIVHNIDDLDLCWRIWSAGYRIKYFPQSITYHWTMKSLSDRSKVTPSVKSEFHFQKTLRIFLKNYEWLNILRYTPWLYSIFILRIIVNALKGNLAPFEGFLKAQWWNIQVLPDTLKERKRIQSLRKLRDKEILSHIGLQGSFFKIYKHDINQSLARTSAALAPDAQKNIRTCIICQNEFYISEKFGPLKEKYFYLSCPHCSGVRLEPYPDHIFKEKYIVEEYYENLSKPVNNPLLDRLLNIKLYELPWEWVNKKFPKGSVLDVGCGNGEFLNGLKVTGWDIWGNDISEIAIRNTRKRTQSDDHIIQGEFTLTTFPQQFDLISFWHVLEHINNPQAYANTAFQSLKTHGYMIGEVPNYSSLSFHLFKHHYSWIMLPEHNIYYTKESLHLILAKAGFQQIEIHCPQRALLNLPLSIRNYLAAHLPHSIAWGITLLTLPLGLSLAMAASLLGRGEVLRFSAKKTI